MSEMRERTDGIRKEKIERCFVIIMPIKCKYGKVRYRRKKVGRPRHHFLQLAYCPIKGKKKGKLVEAKLKAYKDRTRLKRVI